MANLQTFETPSGDKMVVLPLAEYEALLDAADVAEATEIAARIKSGEEETFPDAVVARLLEGESPTKVYRQHRGMTQGQLATATGATQGYISDIETGKREGTVKTMVAIARALGVDLDDLVDA